MKSHLEEEFSQQIRLLELPEPEREYRFAAHRVGLGKGIRERLREAGLKDWRFDFAWLHPDRNVAVEIEGGIWTRGAHNRGEYYRDNCYKYNAAALQGWLVLRFTDREVKSGEAVNLVQLVIKQINEGKWAWNKHEKHTG